MIGNLNIVEVNVKFMNGSIHVFVESESCRVMLENFSDG